MRKLLASSIASILLLAAAAGAQDKPEAPPAPPPARKPVTPLRVQLVFTKYQGERKTSSLPYTLTVNADDNRSTKLRMGIEVPVTVSAPVPNAPASFQYRNVGTNIDCSAETVEEGRFKLFVAVEQSSIYTAEGESRQAGFAVPAGAIGPQPLFRTFNTSFSPVLKDGQSAQYTAATDPVSGEVVKVDVTVAVVR